MACAGALCVTGCGSGQSTARTSKPKTPGSARASLSSLVGRPQEALLSLPRGRSTANFVVTAVAHDAWDVRIAAPASADFEVNALKSDGERLSLLETTHQREECATTGARVRCFMRFAVGANQAPGSWTVIAKKRTSPATTARIQITFHRPGSE